MLGGFKAVRPHVYADHVHLCFTIRKLSEEYVRDETYSGSCAIRWTAHNVCGRLPSPSASEANLEPWEIEH
jgi:hypothetical protein